MTLGLDPADIAAVTAIVRAAGTSFHRGMAILPPARRAAMYGIYAFCRRVDDIADDDGSAPADRAAALDEWRGRIAGLAAGRAKDPVTRVLAAATAAFGLRPADFHAVIDGMAMDIDPIVAPDWPTLDLYCDRVAAAVGRLSVRAFGDASADADEVAHHLGRALQLTNILRDLDEDAARGRLYLPAEWLAEAGIQPAPAAALAAPALPVLCRRLADHADAHFASARAAMRLCQPRAMRPARLMGATYAALLRATRARGWEDRARPARIPTWHKLLLAFRYGLGPALLR